MSSPREHRPSSRSHRQNLQLPHHGLGRGDLIRSRSPSPANPGASNRPTSQQQSNIDQFMDDSQESHPVSLLSIDIANGVRSDPSLQQQQQQQPQGAAAAPQQPSAMPTIEEQLAEFQRIAQQQHERLQQYEATQLAQQQRFEQSQNTVAQLSQALQSLTTGATSLPIATHAPQRKKPDMPPFDAKHINRWINRLLAAYQRAGVTLAKDKFAFLESTFEVTANPRINQFLYGTNTDTDWDAFLVFLKEEYGKTKRQKAALLIAEYPRQGLRPTQYMAQLKEDTEGVTLDDIKKEQLLKSLPSRIRELLGKEVETLTADQVATKADAYFDRQGNLLERSYSVNSVDPSPANNFTQAFPSDSPTDEVNQVQRTGFRANNRQGRPENRFGKSPASGQARSQSRPGRLIDGLCRTHNKFGDAAFTCVAEGCKKRHLVKKGAPQGNSKGERRQ